MGERTKVMDRVHFVFQKGKPALSCSQIGSHLPGSYRALQRGLVYLASLVFRVHTALFRLQVRLLSALAAVLFHDNVHRLDSQRVSSAQNAQIEWMPR